MPTLSMPLSLSKSSTLRPTIKRLEAAMLDAVRAAGGSAWYVPDDFLTLGPELVGVSSAAVAGTSGYFYSDFVPVVGKSYQISYQYSVTGGTSVQMSLGGSNVPSSTVGSGSVIYTITAANTNPLRCYSNAATATLSGISVKEVMSVEAFQDNAGTLPSYLTGTAGMLYDQAGSVGAELISSPDISASWTAEGTTPPTAVNGSDSFLGKACRSVTFPAVASGGYSVCRARDAENIFNVAAGVTYFVSFEYALSRDLTAGEAVSIAVTGSSGIYSKNLSAGAPGGVWCSGSGGQPAVESGGGTGLRPYATVLNSPLTVYIRKVSVKVAGGVVATQSTAANKPTISRIPRKLGPELVVNGSFDNSDGWTLAAAGTAAAPTVSGGQLVFNSAPSDSTYARRFDSTPLVVGKTYAVSVDIASYTSGVFQVVAIGGTASIISNAVSGAGKKQLVFTATQPNYGIEISRVSGSPFVASFDNISVREVLEWSYALTFDGSNDSLAAPASIIGVTLTQPYTMISAFRVGQTSLGQRTQGDTARWIGLGSSNKLVATHAGGATLGGTSDVAVGDLVIQEVVWDGTSVKIWRNGILETSGAMNAPTGVTPGSHNIGQNGGGTYFKGEKVLDVVCPAVMTDAQRLAVRKFAAAQMRVTL